MRYEIRVEGVLDQHWSDWLDGLQLTYDGGAVTVLTGSVRDEATLHGLMRKIIDARLPLISLTRLDR